MVEDGVGLVDVALLAFNGVVVVGAALGDEAGRDEVALDGPDAEEEARGECHQGRCEDDGELLAVVGRHGGGGRRRRRGEVSKDFNWKFWLKLRVCKRRYKLKGTIKLLICVLKLDLRLKLLIHHKN